MGGPDKKINLSTNNNRGRWIDLHRTENIKVEILKRS